MRMVDVIDESTMEAVGSVPKYDAKEIAEMVDKAYAAQPAWEKVPLHERANILFKFCGMMDEQAEEIALLMCKEMGKPYHRAMSELGYTPNIGRANIEYGKHMFGEVLNDTAPGMENDFIAVTHEAIGVVACVIPFNYPVELTVQKIVPALLMGNTCVVKAATYAPLSVKKIVDLAHEAGVPEDCLHFVTADRDDCTNALLTNPKIACIALTGSNEAGTEMMHHAAPTIKRVSLELGGNDPFIVTEDCANDPELMATAIACVGWGRLTENNGQTCASPKRTLVHRSAHDAFVKGLIEFVKRLKQGPATDPNSDITRLVSIKAAEKVEAQVKMTIEQGAKLIYGGKREGCIMEPVILDNVTKDMDIAKDMEVFGPVIPIITFDTDEEAVEIANQSKYGLSSGVAVSDMKRAFYYTEEIESAAVWVNGTSALRHDDQPFGGCKQTGIGNEGGAFTCHEFVRLKTRGFCGVVPKKILSGEEPNIYEAVNIAEQMAAVESILADEMK